MKLCKVQEEIPGLRPIAFTNKVETMQIMEIVTNVRNKIMTFLLSGFLESRSFVHK